MEIMVYKGFQPQIQMKNDETIGVLCPPVNHSIVSSKSAISATPVYCTSCEKMFLDRPMLEQHVCPFVNYICSCGQGFLDYSEMSAHRAIHNHTSSYITNHFSAIQSRIHDVKMQEMKLKKLEGNIEADRAEQNSAGLKQSQVTHRSGRTKNLWCRFKPVVMLETLRKFHDGKPYMCAECRAVIWQLDRLIEHVNNHTHVSINGCMDCGLLLLGCLPSSTTVHNCGSCHGAKFTKGKVQGMLSVKNDKEFYNCQQCSLKFSHELHLRNHVRMNHANLRRIQEITMRPTTVKRAKSTKGIRKQRSTRASRARDDIVQKPRQHWFSEKLALLKTEALADEAFQQTGMHNKVQFQSSPLSHTKRSCSEVTLQFRASRSIKTYKLKEPAIKTEPIELSAAQMQPELMSVKKETESDYYDDNGLQHTPTNISQLLYQTATSVFPVLQT